MDNVQIIETLKGEKLAVMPLGAYEKLRDLAGDEDARDIRAADKIMAGIKTGKIGTVPLAVAKAITLDGAHPVRAFRQHRGMTAAALAKKAGLSRATVTQIETRHRHGTAKAYAALARALGTTTDALLKND